MKSARFSLGRLLATPNALAHVSHPEIQCALHRHVTGDWGEVDHEDWQANEAALMHACRLLSVYRTANNIRFYIITEADRLTTNVDLDISHRIVRLMKRTGLCGCQSRYRVQTTDSHRRPHHCSQSPRRSPTGPASNQIWVADSTYIHTQDGWLYLAGVLDLHSRRIVGWAMSPTIDSSLVMAALTMATTDRRSSAGLLFHSDRGIQ